MKTKTVNTATYQPVEQMLDKLMGKHKLSCFNSKNDLSALYRAMVDFKSKHGGLKPFETNRPSLQMAIEKYLKAS